MNHELKEIWEMNLPIIERKKLLKAKLLEGVLPEVKAKFDKLSNERPEIFRLFSAKAYEMSEVREVYSSKSIMFSIRWDMDIKYNTQTFKINDAYIALFTRKLILKDPDTFIGFFRLKQLREMKLNSTKEKNE